MTQNCLLSKKKELLRSVYTCNFCCDFLLLTDVNEYTSMNVPSICT